MWPSALSGRGSFGDVFLGLKPQAESSSPFGTKPTSPDR